MRVDDSVQYRNGLRTTAFTVRASARRWSVTPHMKRDVMRKNLRFGLVAYEAILSKPLFIAAILRILPSSGTEGYAQKEALKNIAFSKKSIPAWYFMLDSVIFCEIRRCSDRRYGKKSRPLDSGSPSFHQNRKSTQRRWTVSTHLATN